MNVETRGQGDFKVMNKSFNESSIYKRQVISSPYQKQVYLPKNLQSEQKDLHKNKTSPERVTQITGNLPRIR